MVILFHFTDFEILAIYSILDFIWLSVLTVYSFTFCVFTHMKRQVRVSITFFNFFVDLRFLEPFSRLIDWLLVPSLPFSFNEILWHSYVDPSEGVSWVWHKAASGGEATLLEFSGMQSTYLLVLFPSPFWPGMVVPVRVLCRGQIDLFGSHLRVT